MSGLLAFVQVFQGWKTYLIALAMLIYAGASYWNGDMSQIDAIQFALNALGLGALRAGVAKAAT